MLSILLVTTASAQLGTEGTITGTVTDPSGAAVPSVAITITNNGTNAVTKSKTTDRGEYVATGLQIGRYRCAPNRKALKWPSRKT